MLACRSVTSAEQAAADIAEVASGPAPVVHQLDLGDLRSVRAFAGAYSGQRVDLLVNNAGVMMTPHGRTRDGFELQLGINHLGHFALTGLLLDASSGAKSGRIVTVQQQRAQGRQGSTSRDLNWERESSPRVRPTGAPSSPMPPSRSSSIFRLHQRALACDQRARAIRDTPRRTCSGAARPASSGRYLRCSNRVVAQGPERGVLPILYAATAPDVERRFLGPDGAWEMRGFPKRVQASSADAYDPCIGAKLWQVSEELTGVRYSGSIAGFPSASRRDLDSR